MSPATPALVAGLASLLTGLWVTPRVRKLAHRIPLVAAPSSDRWHTQPTPLLGGVAVLLATLVGAGVWAAWSLLSGDLGARPPVTLPAAAVAGSAAFMFAVGLVDDITRLRPQLKFVLQTLAGVGLIAAGATLALTPWYVVNVVVTVFWFVAVTNAFNLLDNMDGVAAGVGAIAAAFLGVVFARQGAWLHAAVAWCLAGAMLSFLRYNFFPARIFMGDAGSLFIGSLLAGLVATSPASASGSLVAVLFVPLVIMAVPVLDTTLVTITRALATRGISQGGRDHSTHRLVALGLGERQVAVLLYVFAALGGTLGLVLMRLDVGLGVALGTAFLVGMCLLAAYLARLRIAYPDTSAGSSRLTVLATELLYKRRLAEMLLDVTLVTLAYYGAYRLKFDGGVPPEYLAAFESTVGLVIACKVVTLAALGVYRGDWRYVGVGDVYRITGAILLGSVAFSGYAYWREPLLGGSNILLIDPLLAAALVLAARMSFTSLEMVRRKLRRGGERVAIYGAGDGGELAVRELLSNAELRLQPFCFLDDDARKHGARIHGVPVVGGFERLGGLVERDGVRRILIGTKKLRRDVLQGLEALAARHDVMVLELDIQVRTMSLDGNGRGAPPAAEKIVVHETTRLAVDRVGSKNS